MVNKPRVLNQKVDGLPESAVLIDRTTKWGNPFKSGRDGSRSEVIERYRLYLAWRPELMAALEELRGKDLVCHCKPKACHGDVLIDLANRQPQADLA